jgi:hypothetical protein
MAAPRSLGTHVHVRDESLVDHPLVCIDAAEELHFLIERARGHLGLGLQGQGTKSSPSTND